MDEQQLLRRYRWAYHVAWPESLASIEKLGLLSTASLLDAYGVSAEARAAIEGQRRDAPVTLQDPSHGTAVVRDHGPMSETKLSKLLLDNMTPADWYRELDRYVFFWLDPRRVQSMLHAYKSTELAVIAVPTANLLARCRDNVRLAPINTGSTRAMAKRGRSTFLPLADYHRSDIAELCVLGQVADVAEYVERVDVVAGGGHWDDRATRVAILGWGSLLWDPRNLDYVGRWEQGGPTVELEFSRISGGNRLTLVVDREHGRACPTYYARSGRSSTDEAAGNLRDREEMSSSRRIGVARRFARVKAVDAVVGKRIQSWTADHSFDATIWTDLQPNFGEHDLTYSKEEAEKYLKALPAEQRAEAHRYISNAPPTIRTDFTDLLDVNGPC